MYIRRSSSTDIATIDEISKMGVVLETQRTSPNPTDRLSRVLTEARDNQSKVLIEVNGTFGRMRRECLVEEINEDYAVFLDAEHRQERFSSALDELSYSLEPNSRRQLFYFKRTIS